MIRNVFSVGLSAFLLSLFIWGCGSAASSGGTQTNDGEGSTDQQVIGLTRSDARNQGTEKKLSCGKNDDCVPDSCCHSAGCVATESAPKCEGVMCTADCRPDTMDCGAGSCVCREGLCFAQIHGKAGSGDVVPE